MTQRSCDVQGLPRSLNELLILATLESGAKHGYQIGLEIEERSGGFFGFNHGTLYPILHQLEKEELIHGDWASGEGRRKKEYALSGAGREHLERRSGEWRELGSSLGRFLGAGGEPVRSRAEAG
jgi:PadR family transcriptional regulator, regulatory protein PadR